MVFEPLDLIGRLAALVPAPYLALRRFHGVFGTNHHPRCVIVPTPVANSVTGGSYRPPDLPSTVRWTRWPRPDLPAFVEDVDDSSPTWA